MIANLTSSFSCHKKLFNRAACFLLLQLSSCGPLSLLFVSFLSLTTLTIVARDTVPGWALVDDSCSSGTALCDQRFLLPLWILLRRV
jgi:hypothetical protein